MYSPKLNWIKFNELFSNRTIEPLSMLDISGSKYPINIKNNYVDGDSEKECSAKCSFSFKYPSGSLILTNKGGYLELDYDNGTTSPVIFNAEKYKVHKIYILNKPLHYFEGKSGIGEILVYHTSDEGAIPLIVSIPISSTSSSGSKLGQSSLENVINIAYENTSNNDDSATTLNTNSFTLNDYFPPAGTPFYTYKGENFLNSSHFSAEEVHYIIYDKEYGVYLDQSGEAKNKLDTIISTENILNSSNKNAAETNNDDENLKEKIFINNTGASVFEGDDDIYIDCSPTGDSDNEVAFKMEANSITGGITSQKYDFMLSVVTKFSISIIIILGIWYAPYYVTDLLNGKDIMRKFEDMTFGGPAGNFISLENEIKSLNRELLGTEKNTANYNVILSDINKKEQQLKDMKSKMNEGKNEYSKSWGLTSAMDQGNKNADNYKKLREMKGKYGSMAEISDDLGKWGEGKGDIEQMKKWSKDIFKGVNETVGNPSKTYKELTKGL